MKRIILSVAITTILATSAQAGWSRQWNKFKNHAHRTARWTGKTVEKTVRKIRDKASNDKHYDLTKKTTISLKTTVYGWSLQNNTHDVVFRYIMNGKAKKRVVSINKRGKKHFSVKKDGTITSPFTGKKVTRYRIDYIFEYS